MKRIIIINVLLIIIYFLIPTQYIKNIQAKQSIIIGINNEISFEENLNIDFEMDLRTKSNIKKETLAKMLKGTQMEGLEDYFIQAEQKNGINAIYLTSLACHESAYNTSNFAKTRNNLFGWQSYDSNLNATKQFKTKEECILFVSSRIKVLYLDKGNTTIQSISNKYASDKEHGKKVFKIMQKLVDKVS